MTSQVRGDDKARLDVPNILWQDYKWRQVNVKLSHIAIVCSHLVTSKCMAQSHKQVILEEKNLLGN